MSIFNQNLGLFGSSIQSGGQSTSSKISRRICASLLAGFMFAGVSTQAYTTNVLVNPGAETGDLTGWQQSLTGYKYAVLTNYSSGSSINLAHSGKYTFQLFDTTGDAAIMYQDYAAIAGSQWTATGYAISYASNYLSTTTSAHMQAVFYDSNNIVVPYPAAETYSTSGIYDSLFMDPNAASLIGLGIPAIVPPPAVDATGWMFLQTTNLNNDDPADYGGVDTALITPPLTAPPGTAKIRYEIYLINTSPSGGAVYWDDLALNKLNLTDPDITNPPVAVTVYGGGSAQFSVGAFHTGAHPNEKFHYQWQCNGTNLPATGGVNNIAFGTTTAATLNFTNCSSIASGMYDVVVTVNSAADGYTNSITSVPVPLNVLTLSPLQKANALNYPGVNAGFESNPVWPPWNFFNGAYFATAASVYGTSTTTVNVLDGASVALIGNNGDRDNGIWNAIPASPGTIWKAGGWAYISSLFDLSGGNTCRLQVWFKNAYNGTDSTVTNTPTYESFKLYGTGYTNADAQYVDINTNSPTYGQTLYHTQLPRDQWFYLPATNAVNDGGIGLTNDLPYATLPSGDFMVPTNAGTSYINVQVYGYVPVAADSPQPDLPGVTLAGVYWDDIQLFQVLPVTNLTASVSGGNVNLSFSAGAGLTYSVLYKTNLTDAAWNVLQSNIAAPLTWQTNTAATTTTWPLTVTDSTSGQHTRFYKVQSQ
jgi:hypothetical protein